MDERHLVVRRADFERLYDLDDPRPYYRALQPLGYRAPEVAGTVLAHWQPHLARAFGTARPRLLDFACGYGAVGAFVRHALTSEQLYRHYCDEATAALEAAAARDRDRRFFERRRRTGPGYFVGGIDIARCAVGYALETGLVDEAFHRDLSTGTGDAALEAFLASTDVVVEAGAIGAVLPAAFEAIISAAQGPRLPWFLMFSRPDVDYAPLRAVMARHGYAFETVTPRPVRYRRLIGAEERRDVFRDVEALGADPRDHFEADHFLVHLLLVRPSADVAAPPLGALLQDLPEGLLS